MPHTIVLKYFPEGSASENVDFSLPESIVAKQQNLKLEQEGTQNTLLIWKEEQQEWRPLLWITGDNTG